MRQLRDISRIPVHRIDRVAWRSLQKHLLLPTVLVPYRTLLFGAFAQIVAPRGRVACACAVAQLCSSSWNQFIGRTRRT